MTLSRKSAICASLLLMFGVVGACPSHAWSEAGHLYIAEAAAQALPAKERKALNSVVTHLTEQMKSSDELRDRYGPVSALALTGPWLDSQRGKPLAEIFEDYGRGLPEELQGYADETTDNWHYSNRFYDPAGYLKHDGCRLRNAGELNRALPKLYEAYGNAEAPKNRAIILALLVHLLQDAHQPLHSISRVERGCRHDRGGNTFCTLSSGGRCERNLHQEWDAGLGIFGEGYLASVAGREARQPEEAPEALLESRVWQEENLALAEELYSLTEGRAPNRDYRAWAQMVARDRAHLAAERLAWVLNSMAQQ